MRKINNFIKTLSLRAKVPNTYGARLYVFALNVLYQCLNFRGKSTKIGLTNHENDANLPRGINTEITCGNDGVTLDITRLSKATTSAPVSSFIHHHAPPPRNDKGQYKLNKVCKFKVPYNVLSLLVYYILYIIALYVYNTLYNRLSGNQSRQ